MILAIDIGNSHIVLGCFDNKRIVFTERVATDLKKTELEYAIILKAVLELHGTSPQQLEGAVISSVVPPLVPVLCNAIEKISPNIRPLVVDHSIRTGLPIRLDHPEQVVVTQTEEGGAIVLHLHVAESDMGKVIGRHGKIARSIRLVIKSASASLGKRVSVDID